MKPFCNLIASVLLTLLIATPASAQFVTLPDAAFVTWLNANGYASCLNGNQLDTTCTQVTSATKVNCSNSGITSLDGIRYFDMLDTLSCSSNMLTLLPVLPPVLKYLNCNANDITALPALPATLINLECYGNQLTFLPALPPQLERLDCSQNMLTGLPSLPSTLDFLGCYYNQISSFPSLPPLTYFYCHNNPFSALPALPNGLQYLSCGSSNITTLPTLPSSIFDITCYSSQITSLPVLPASLWSLRCENNFLTSLPALPANLHQLIFTGNQVTSLPAIPAAMENLQFNSNQISSIPTLPAGLEHLYCSNNLLSSLPALPSSLLSLLCSGNSLTSIPPVPMTMTRLLCYDNQLTSLPELPDSMNQFFVSNNPNLLCLPRLKKINLFQFQNTGIQCLPDYGTIVSSIPNVTTYPVCDLFNPNACPAFGNISGRVYFDQNTNCLPDITEVGMGNMKILLDSSGVLTQQTYTGGAGMYSFDTSPGTYSYTVDTTGLPVFVNCPSGGNQTSILTVVDSVDFDMHFAMRCKTGFDIGVKAVAGDSGTFRPGHFSRIRIPGGDMSRLFGLQCASGISGQFQVTINGPATYISASPGSLVPVVNGNILQYTVADFGTVNFQSAFSFTIQTDTTAITGNSICFTINVTPGAGDLNVANNSLVHCFNVVASYDPNAKTASHVIALPTQDWLTYTVQFQNTGTASAEHIYIIDTLDGAVIPSSFELLAFSHPNITQLSGNIVHFNFPNIDLPDSTSNEPGSHGYIQYRVRMMQGLPLGTAISNTAHIYFDFNAPIVTNTVLTFIMNNVGIPETALQDQEISISPNPVTRNEITVTQKAVLHKNTDLRLYDLSGRCVFKVLLSGTISEKIQLPVHLSGIYILSLQGGSKPYRTKLLVRQ